MANLIKLKLVSVNGRTVSQYVAINTELIRTHKVYNTSQSLVYYNDKYGTALGGTRLVFDNTNASISAAESNITCNKKISITTLYRQEYPYGAVTPYSDTLNIGVDDIVYIYANEKNSAYSDIHFRVGVKKVMVYTVASTIDAIVEQTTNAPASLIKTVKKTIGGVGVSGCDFNFATAANQTAQNIDLGAIIPAYARIVDGVAYCNSTFTGAVSLACTVGVTSTGSEIAVSGAVYTAGNVIASATGISLIGAISSSAQHVFIGATPGANWNLATAGKMTIAITYIDTIS